ncbi:SusC/RagA family TonB-linked outer membrane protein [Chitinophaga sp. CC14]|uniref:SusC/RagA family TonB-linked outer membrane protein n=1 Tax=Chitinophaga sp. CC14 TaxID=3029199 RepID=UPI003B829E88
MSLPLSCLWKIRRFVVMSLLSVLVLSITYQNLQAKAFGHQVLITLNLKDASLITVFKKIEQCTNYGFLYNSDVVLKSGKAVTIIVKNEKIQTVLDLALRDQPFNYKIDGNSVIISSKPKEKELSISNKNPSTDTTTVTGYIRSAETGQGVAGATVLLKGTSNGAITDEQGKFLLRNIASFHGFLIVHCIGYESQQIQFNGQSNFTIELKRATNVLDESVVLGYGSTTNRFNTGSVNRISGQQINTQPVSNPLAALEGRIPGVYINQLTGVAGGAINIQVRGKSSIYSGAAPLYLVDGIPFTTSSVGSSSFASSITFGGNPLNSLNPADIESIEVLKDADATAIYGSRGANGVVLITTKKGKAGATKVNLGAYSGFGKVTNKLALLSTPQYIQMRHEAFANDNTTPNPGNAPDLLLWDTTKYTDWQSRLIGGSAKISDFQASLSGGNNNTQFLLGGSYHKETTVFPGNFGDSRGSAYFNLNHLSASKKFKAAITASYSADINDLFYNDLTSMAVYLPPNTPDLADKSGNVLWPVGSPSIIGSSNPYAYLNQRYHSSTYNLITALQTSYQLLPFLQVKVNGGYTRMQVDQDHIVPLSTFNPASNPTASNAYSQFGNSSIETWILEPQLNYNKILGHLVIDAIVGTSFQQNVLKSRTLQGTGYGNETLMENLSAANSTSVVSDNYSLYHYNGLFARVNLNLNSKYILNLTGRRDGSSRFGPGKQFGNFGAAGAAWIFSEESAIKNLLPFLTFGKLRASYGTTGNDNIGDYQYLSTWYPTSFPYDNVGGLAPSRIAVPDYSWEVTKKLEAGISLGFLKNRILVNGAYYQNRSSNQLLPFSIPPSAGFINIFANFPAVIQNSGFEFDINSENIKARNFTWSTFFNLTLPKNKLVAFPGIENTSYANQYIVGKPITIVKRMEVIGVDPATGLYQFKSAKDGTSTSFPSYPDDLTTYKNVTQTFYGGIGNNLRFKNLTLDFLFQFVKQQGYDYRGTNMPGIAQNQPISVLTRWQKPGDVTNVQKYSNGDFNALIPYIYYGLFADKAITDASFVRLKNVQLSYSINDKWLKSLKIDKANVYLRGQNLWTITGYKGLDPELSISSSAILRQPSLRVIVAGIQLTL